MPLISRGSHYGAPIQQDDDNERFGRQVGMQQMQYGQQSQRDLAVLAAQERLQQMALDNQRQIAGTFGERSQHEAGIERQRGQTQIGVAGLNTQPALEGVRGNIAQREREWGAGATGRQVEDARARAALQYLQPQAGGTPPSAGNPDIDNAMRIAAMTGDSKGAFAAMDASRSERRQDEQGQMSIALKILENPNASVQAKEIASQMLAKTRMFGGMDSKALAGGLTPARNPAEAAATDPVLQQGLAEIKDLATKLTPGFGNIVGQVRRVGNVAKSAAGLGDDYETQLNTKISQLRQYAQSKGIPPDQFDAFLKQTIGEGADNVGMDLFGVNPAKRAIGLPQ